MMKHILFYCVLFVRSISAMEEAPVVLAPIHAFSSHTSKEELGKNFVDVIHAPLSSAEHKQTIASLLIKMGVDPNYTHEGYPLLHRCFWENNTLGVVLLLIENKADRSLLDREKKTAFHYALNHPSATNSTRFVRTRYAMGLFADEYLDAQLQKTSAPICVSEHPVISVASQMQLYRNSCLVETIRCERSLAVKKKIITYLIEQGAQINQLYRGLTPLQHSLRYAGSDADAIVEFLLTKNADPSVGDAIHKTAFFHLLNSKNTTEENCFNRVKMLYEQGAIGKKS